MAKALAQDVTLLQPAWVDDASDMPERLPVIEGFKPKFPADLKATTEVGYTLIRTVVDKDGKVLTWRTYSSTPAYENESLNGFNLKKISPGRRGGKPVITETRAAVIYNPASAAIGKTDSTPRLLEAHWVIDPRRDTKVVGASVLPLILWATVSLDAEGKPVKLNDVQADMAELLEANIKTWRFAPAQRNGKPVEAEVRVPFIIVESDYRINPSGSSKPARAIRQSLPIYPPSMQTSGLRGEVLIDFFITVEGRVTNAYVVKTLNPAFNEAALKAVREWRFEPKLNNGIPERTQERVPIIFNMNTPDSGNTGFELGRKPDQSKLPPAFRYDKAAKITVTVKPVFPYALLKKGVRGSASARFLVDANGRVVYADVVKADHPEFGDALVAALDFFEFIPAVKDGNPTQMVMGFEQEFDAYDQELVSWDDKALMTLETERPEQIVTAGKLDKPLQPISRRAPSFPAKLQNKTNTGTALVEMLIDKDGAVRLPRVISATEPAFGYAAVQAVSFWRFEPPIRGGSPAIVRVRVPFDFILKNSKGDAPTKK